MFFSFEFCSMMHFFERVRPEQIRWSKEADQHPLTVFNYPQSKDIIQGCVGNCWFTSALSLIADIPQILNKVMITKQYNPAGK